MCDLGQVRQGVAVPDKKPGYNSMTRITNTILSPSIPNLQYKKYLNGRLSLTLIIPSHPSRCVSWDYNQKSVHYQCSIGYVTMTRDCAPVFFTAACIYNYYIGTKRSDLTLRMMFFKISIFKNFFDHATALLHESKWKKLSHVAKLCSRRKTLSNLRFISYTRQLILVLFVWTSWMPD